MSGAVATVCGLCPAGEAGLAGKLRGALADTGLMIEVRSSGCMSGCTRQSTLAFRAPGKMAYLFGEITLADLPELLTFARLYLASPDGDLADARPLGALRTKVIARIPG
jgi:predicted metal-binding protein